MKQLIKRCDFCGKKVNDWPYVLKLYKRFTSSEFFTIYELCDNCSNKIKALQK